MRIRNKKTGEVREVSEEELEQYGLGGKIHIKESKKGSLHKHLGIPEGEKIPASKLKVKSTDSPAIKKKKVFAQNARKWKKQFGGEENNTGILTPKLLPEENTMEVNPFIHALGSDPSVGTTITDFSNNSFENPNISFSDDLKLKARLYPNVKKGNISIPEIKQAPNFKQTIETPQIHSYDFYNPETGEVNQSTKKQKPSFNPSYIPNTFSPNKYFARANYYRNLAINDFANMGQAKYGKSIPTYEMGGNGYINMGAGIANAMLSDINTAKGFTDMFGNFNVNNQIAQMEAQAKRENLFNQYNNPQTFSPKWGGDNPLEGVYSPFKYGGNVPKAEYGIPSQFDGKMHSEGGIPVNLNQSISEANDAKVPRNKATLEVEDKEYHLKSKQNGGELDSDIILSRNNKLKIPAMDGKSYNPSEALNVNSKMKFGITPDKLNSKLAKRTKLIEDNEKVFNSNLNKNTEDVIAQLVIPLSEQMQEMAMNFSYIPQEYKKKALGMDNDIDGNNSPQAKYGGLQKAQNGIKENPRVKSNYPPIQYPQTTEIGFQYNAPNQYDWLNWQRRIDENAATRFGKVPLPQDTSPVLSQLYYGTNDQQALTNMAYQEQSYDDALDTPEGRRQLAKMWEQTGKTLKGNKLNIDTTGLTKLNDTDLTDVLKRLRPAYIDSQLDYRKVDYLTPQNIEKAKKELETSDNPSFTSKTATDTKTKKPGFTTPGFNFYIPNSYMRDPITGYDVNYQGYDPTTITPYVNDINREQFASLQNLGASGAELALRASLFGKASEQRGKRYYDANVFNAQTKTQAARDNALTRLQNAQTNRQSYYDYQRNPQLQREAAITEQQQLDINPYLKRITDKEHEGAVQDYLSTIYNPEYAFNLGYGTQNPETKKKTAKYGGKLKLKKKK